MRRTSIRQHQGAAPVLVRLKVFRFDPEKDAQPRYENYEVDADPTDRLLDCLNRIRWEQDPTLSFRMSCGHGVCGSDGMRINGVCALPCQKLVKSFEGEIVVEPLPVFRIIKDLVVDLEPFFEKYRSIKPYLMASSAPPDEERTQTPEEIRRIEGAIRCILCACCTSSCPVNRNEETKDYVGPAALVRAFRYLFDSRDEGVKERIALLDREAGVWGCQTLWKCTEVCPKEIPVTTQIGQIKRKIYEMKKEGK
ncbi:MAG: Succinate dehydrogenase iron-sulfur subunit [Syntrophorhabdaceae bacterium PtaU1.Bin034]|nr:MAG: Succinate dehydrogenase iron-sulfur subunit [Syntrophorhabdaceae bacterium PtaU1.Bin034]